MLMLLIIQILIEIEAKFIATFFPLSRLTEKINIGRKAFHSFYLSIIIGTFWINTVLEKPLTIVPITISEQLSSIRAT